MLLWGAIKALHECFVTAYYITQFLRKRYRMNHLQIVQCICCEKCQCCQTEKVSNWFNSAYKMLVSTGLLKNSLIKFFSNWQRATNHSWWWKVHLEMKDFTKRTNRAMKCFEIYSGKLSSGQTGITIRNNKMPNCRMICFDPIILQPKLILKPHYITIWALNLL